MKIAETVVKQMKVYLKEGIRNALGGIEDDDVLEWHVVPRGEGKINITVVKKEA